MNGLSAAFWSALAGVCLFFAERALTKSEFWAERANEFNRRAAL